MNQKDFEKIFREYEASSDMLLQPDHFVVARIDGRNFHTLTRNILKLRPFDLHLSGGMLNATYHVMQCGFNCIYGFTQSDEISLLLNKYIEPEFNGKIRKYNSILASEATAAFCMHMQLLAAFDCRILQLPTFDAVTDYFVWRRRDTERNALNTLAYDILRKEGKTPSQAQKVLDGTFSDTKQNFLFEHGINFNLLEPWKKRGFGVHWEKEEKEGYNPKTKETVQVMRNKLRTVLTLPQDDNEYRIVLRDLDQHAYNAYVYGLLLEKR